MDATLKSHPVTLIKKHQWKYELSTSKLTSSDHLASHSSSRANVFGMVQIIQSPPTAKGMFFITLEDEKGFLNLVLKPQIYEKYKSTIQTEWALLVSGRIQKQASYVSLLVDHIFSPASNDHLYDFRVKPEKPPTAFALERAQDLSTD